MTRSPSLMGWRKVIESIATVTTFFCACRIQERAPASSASFMIQPPCTLPSKLACSGCINCESVMREARIDLGGRVSVIGVSLLKVYHVSEVVPAIQKPCEDLLYLCMAFPAQSSQGSPNPYLRGIRHYPG